MHAALFRCRTRQCYLVAHGGQVSAVDHGGRTPLHYVASREVYADDDGGVSVARLLISKGAKINAQDKQGLSRFG